MEGGGGSGPASWQSNVLCTSRFRQRESILSSFGSLFGGIEEDAGRKGNAFCKH